MLTGGKSGEVCAIAKGLSTEATDVVEKEENMSGAAPTELKALARANKVLMCVDYHAVWLLL